MQNEIRKRSNKAAYEYWKQQHIILETAITNANTKHNTSAILSFLNVYGIPKYIFNGSFGYDYGSIIYTKDLDKFKQTLIDVYKTKANITLLHEVRLKTRGVKFTIHGVLQCTIFENDITGIDTYEKTSDISGKKVIYMSSKYYLPILYRWIIEKRYDDLNYIDEMIKYSIKNIKIKDNTNMNINKYTHNLKNIVGDDVVTGLPAAYSIITQKDINLSYPLTVLSTDIEKSIDNARKLIPNKTEVIFRVVNHPGFERYFSFAMLKDIDKQRIVYSVYDYPTFAIIGYHTNNNIKYTDKYTTLIMLCILAWSFERSGSPLYDIYNTAIKKLSKVAVTESTITGTYYGHDLWRGYSNKLDLRELRKKYNI